MKKYILLSLILFSLLALRAQSNNKDVTITASGSGATLEAAKQAALRSAIEQAYGAFISTKTEMLNDQVVADEMTSVSAGNIKSYEVLNQDSLPDGRWGLTLKAVVSIDKLTSFVEAKGGTVEIKGGMFALNIKQQLLNEQGEINAIAEMVGLLHEPMQTAFDYTIKSGTPQSVDAESKNWEIPLEVTATCNKNMDFCAKYFIKTLAAISLSNEEVETYKSLNKSVFTVSVNFEDKSFIFNLRKQMSLNTIYYFTSNWDFYTRQFIVYSGIDTSDGIGKSQLHNLTDVNGVINFPIIGQVAGLYKWRDKRTLNQIEQMAGYSVAPKGVVSLFRHGGYVIYEQSGHGLVVALYDIGTEENHDAANTACENAEINGYNDWRLPSEAELWQIQNNIGVMGIGRFGWQCVLYWGSIITRGPAGAVDLWPKQCSSWGVPMVRAVRTF